ncbi:MAG: lytic transglycosylase domain-containing protein [Deltaproteobacteria bacterium]|nr:lytic transglycosylase domain-containing protein [Deltaproteobacteria bacterium]
MFIAKKFFLVLLVPCLFTMSSVTGKLHAEENPFPVPNGLRDAVDFWKKIFTLYSEHEIVFHNPEDHKKIYSVISVPENKQNLNALINAERARIINQYGLHGKTDQVRSQRGAREQFQISHERSQRYLTGMRRVFREEKLPVDLAYLPHVESAFDNSARSHAGALGIWQLMPIAIVRFNQGDMRLDPYASTRAAAKILRENYLGFGKNWPLALTAYNFGPTAVAQARDAVGSSDLVTIIREYNHSRFGYEPKNFYAEFLAIREMLNNKEAPFLTRRPFQPFRFREVKIKKAVPVQSLLKTAAVHERQFFDWNKSLDRRAEEVPAGYALNLPRERMERFISVHRQLVDTPPVSQLASARPPRKRLGS